ncbi:MAG: arylamine N-acetyltransferase [Oscillospiraceae bacterium]|jgi:N-hydroxyarylamine O-acetyltransferase|nr:arylamine N-acetyltransferase [Oscillospiraceae bacterium]
MSEFITQYFERIGLVYNRTEPRTAALLDKIQYAHVTHVPYENIDILNGIPISLDTDRLFEKIVLRGRGGYCFELNGLLGWLLRELGFEVKDCMARFLRAETEIPMRRHRILLVTTEDKKTFICDVGVGSVAPRLPVPFVFGEVFEQFGEQYRLRKDNFFGTVLEEFYKGAWRDVFGFTAEPQLDIDYVMPSFYCEKHPDSIFNKSFMVSLKTETSRVTMDNFTYKEFEGDRIALVEELDEISAVARLKEKFGIIW